MSSDSALIDHCVEEICTLGCRTVATIIRDWDSHRPVMVMGLSPQQQQQVLLELKSIMIVYERAGSCSLE
jgi:hypothetical protein